MTKMVASRIISLIGLLSFVMVFGTVGFVLLEKWTLADSLYMTLITISTVGYGEIQELSQSGRAFTSILIVLSMVSMVCWTAGITSVLVNADLTGAFQKKKELKMISKMTGHVVVCGGGVMARTVVSGLIRKGMQVVVISDDKNEMEIIRRLYPALLVVESDPKSELALADANVLKADHLIAATDSDYDNLLITITGRGLGTSINIVSCVLKGELANKMLKVGASQVVCPMVLCGEHVSSLISANEELAVPV